MAPKSRGVLDDLLPSTHTPGPLPDVAAAHIKALLPANIETQTETIATPAPLLCRVSRPPNAFILFRSHFLREKVIPTHVETRQQNLSRIVGQCWNLMTQDQKDYWRTEAKNARSAHQKNNPGYKFSPVRKKRGVRSDIDEEERIRLIRETYTTMSGPARLPHLRQKNRASPALFTSDFPMYNPNLIASVLATASVGPEGSVQSNPKLSDLEHHPSDAHPASSMPALPVQETIPYAVPPRRPSTSLGFSLLRDLSQDTAIRSKGGPRRKRPSSANGSGVPFCLHPEPHRESWDYLVEPSNLGYGTGLSFSGYLRGLDLVNCTSLSCSSNTFL